MDDLVTALQQRYITLDQIKANYSDIEDYVSDTAESIWSRDQRSRSREQIYYSVLKGFMCELAVCDILRTCNVAVEWSAHDWKNQSDLVTCGQRIEVKSQSLTLQRKFFSILSKREDDQYGRVKNLIENRKSFDYVIAVLTDWDVTQGDEHTIFKPWMMIASAAFDPKANLFQRGNGGWFLKTNKARDAGHLFMLSDHNPSLCYS